MGNPKSVNPITHMPANENFRHQMRALMGQKGISQRDLPKLMTGVKCTYPHINRILKGYHSPTMDLADSIARALGVTLESMIKPPMMPKN